MFAAARASSPAEPARSPGRAALVERPSPGSVPTRQSERVDPRADRRASPRRLVPRPGRRRRPAAPRTIARPTATSMGRGGYAAATRSAALSPCAHADPLPRWRDDRHRLAAPARDRAGAGPHRLRDVPGQPQRIDPQPHPVRVRPAATLDAVLLTHAHLDHCGLLPLLVKDGYRGAIHATAGTIELAGLVLLDSGKLHEEFAKREARWEKRHPDKVAADDTKEADQYQAAVDLAAGRRRRCSRRRDGRRGRREHVPTTTVDARATANPPTDRAAWPSDPEAQLRAPAAAPRDRPRRAALHGQGRRGVARLVPGRPTTARRSRSRPGSTPRSSTPATSSARRSSGCASRTSEGGEERIIVCSGDLGRPGHADPARPDRR